MRPLRQVPQGCPILIKPISSFAIRLTAMSEPGPTAIDILLASVMLGIAGFAFYSAAVIVFTAL